MGSIGVNKFLTALNLENNGLSAEAGGAIASALQRSSALQVLCLGSNYLGDAGLVAIARGLKSAFESPRSMCVRCVLCVCCEYCVF